MPRCFEAFCQNCTCVTYRRWLPAGLGLRPKRLILGMLFLVLAVSLIQSFLTGGHLLQCRSNDCTSGRWKPAQVWQCQCFAKLVKGLVLTECGRPCCGKSQRTFDVIHVGKGFFSFFSQFFDALCAKATTGRWGGWCTKAHEFKSPFSFVPRREPRGFCPAFESPAHIFPVSFAPSHLPRADCPAPKKPLFKRRSHNQSPSYTTFVFCF